MAFGGHWGKYKVISCERGFKASMVTNFSCDHCQQPGVNLLDGGLTPQLVLIACKCRARLSGEQLRGFVKQHCTETGILALLDIRPPSKHPYI